MKNYKLSHKLLVIIHVCILLTLNSCKKFVDVDAPTTSVNSDNVFEDRQTATAVLTGIYTKMNNAGGSIKFVPLYSGLSCDELTLFYIQNTTYQAFFVNSLTPSTDTSFWLNYYSLIYKANATIEGLAKSKKLSLAAKNQLIGEAKFVRAYLYFYLVNFYGDIPLALTSDYKQNLLLTRTPKDDIYKQIVADLKDAQSLLSTDYMSVDLNATTSERVRPNKYVATALLAKIYLYLKDYSNAEVEATKIIDNSTYKLEQLDNAFLIGSKEAIWQLYGVSTGVNSNTEEGRIFNLPTTGPSSQYPVYLNKSLYDSFELGDKRKSSWIRTVNVQGNTYPYPFKYKIGVINTTPTEYSMVFRLGEQYLIRAEARLENNKIAEGISDMNVIRARANDITMPQNQQLPQLNLNLNKLDARKALELERLHELFTEGANRWFDLKRWSGYVDASKSRADEILPTLKGTNWQTTDQLYPLPQYDLDQSPNLSGHQNPGY